MDIKTALKRRITGDLEPVPGFEDLGLQVRPRKFSVAARDEINALIIPRSAAIRRLASLKKKEQAREAEEAEGAKAEEAQGAKAEESEDRLAEGLKGLDVAQLALAGVLRLQIARGIESYRIEEEEEKPIGEDFVQSCLEDPALADAVSKIAKRYNAPLPKPTSETSETSSNGSSETSDSGQK